MDRFVVGTGRCGSTLLSRMLGESPQVASLFEFFNGLDMTRRFTDAPMSGPEFAELISQPHPFVTMVLSRGYEVPEIVYPFGPGARFDRAEGLPWILVCMLPRLTDDPDALFDRTLAFARELAPGPPREHYRALFDWLTARAGRRCWVERSGSSIDYVGELARLFPRARFLHIHRDGAEAALSMREHHAFRLAVSLSAAFLRGETPDLERLGELEAGLRDDDVSRLLRERPDASLFGEFWRDQMRRGLAALKQLEPSATESLRFEDLIADPTASLHRVAHFFDLDPDADAWIERAAALVRGQPPSRAAALPPAERARLTASLT